MQILYIGQADLCVLSKLHDGYVGLVVSFEVLAAMRKIDRGHVVIV